MAADSLAGETKPVQTAERYTVVVHAGKDGTAWMETDVGDAPLRPQVVERLDDLGMLLCEQGDRHASARPDADGPARLDAHLAIAAEAKGVGIAQRGNRQAVGPHVEEKVLSDLRLFSHGGLSRNTRS